MTALMRRTDVPPVLADQMQLADVLSKAQVLPQHLTGKPANVLAIMYAAQSVDVPLWQAFQGMQVISGKVGISADLARALILRAGHTFRVEESTDERATVVVIRKGEDYEHRATFTIEDAKRANLTGGSWKTYPKAMLIARATTLVARNACADVLAGMSYTPEELGADVDEEGRVISHAQLVAQTLEDDKKADRVKKPTAPVVDEFTTSDPVALKEWRDALAAADDKDKLAASWTDLNVLCTTGQVIPADRAGLEAEWQERKAEVLAEPAEVDGQVDMLTGEVVEGVVEDAWPAVAVPGEGAA